MRNRIDLGLILGAVEGGGSAKNEVEYLARGLGGQVLEEEEEITLNRQYAAWRQLADMSVILRVMMRNQYLSKSSTKLYLFSVYHLFAISIYSSVE